MRLYHLFYVTALIAASLNLFGPFGIAIGCLIAGAWYYVYSGEGQKRRNNAFEVTVVAVILLLLTCCILSGGSGRFVGRRMACSNNVKTIALAMLNYESVWKMLPPAITYDADVRPMHSWRVLLLPYLEEQRLYDKYSFDEPWDGPNNSKLLSQMPRIYRCPYLPALPTSGFTSGYRVLVGERTCFPPTGARTFSEIRDGLANTILVVESNQLVPWMAPADPTVDEYFAELKDWLPAKCPHRHSELLTHYDSGGSCALADIDVHSFSIPVSKRLLEQLAFVDDGALTLDQLDSMWNYGGVTHIRWEGYLAIAAFLSIAVLPAFWLFRTVKAENSGPHSKT